MEYLSRNHLDILTLWLPERERLDELLDSLALPEIELQITSRFGPHPTE